MTDQQSQQRINQAAEQFTDALVQSYKTVAERGVSAQEGSTQVTEVFFNQTINNLHAQAEQNRQAAEQLADQQQRQAEATQTLTRESVGAYMEFMDSMFSYWQGGIQTAERTVEPAPSSPPKIAESTATSQPSDAELPLDNYDLLRANEVADRIEPLSLEEIKRLRDYEAKNQNRRSVLKRMDERINAASEA
jgi:metal-dependent amidase/aminoacylase/carboxypeptidase family protein